MVSPLWDTSERNESCLLLLLWSGVKMTLSTLLSKEEEGWTCAFWFCYQMQTELAMALLTCFYSVGRERVWKLLRLRLQLSAFPSEALSPASWGWGCALHNWWCKPVSLEVWGSPGSLCNSGLCSRLETAVWFQNFWVVCVCGRTKWLDCLPNLPALFKWGNRHLCIFDVCLNIQESPIST